jgi:hypothetical protein
VQFAGFILYISLREAQVKTSSDLSDPEIINIGTGPPSHASGGQGRGLFHPDRFLKKLL